MRNSQSTTTHLPATQLKLESGPGAATSEEPSSAVTAPLPPAIPIVLATVFMQRSIISVLSRQLNHPTGPRRVVVSPGGREEKAEGGPACRQAAGDALTLDCAGSPPKSLASALLSTFSSLLLYSSSACRLPALGASLSLRPHKPLRQAPPARRNPFACPLRVHRPSIARPSAMNKGPILSDQPFIHGRASLLSLNAFQPSS